jgi:hypothetical protein
MQRLEKFLLSSVPQLPQKNKGAHSRQLPADIKPALHPPAGRQGDSMHVNNCCRELSDGFFRRHAETSNKDCCMHAPHLGESLAQPKLLDGRSRSFARWTFRSLFLRQERSEHKGIQQRKKRKGERRERKDTERKQTENSQAQTRAAKFSGSNAKFNMHLILWEGGAQPPIPRSTMEVL